MKVKKRKKLVKLAVLSSFILLLMILFVFFLTNSFNTTGKAIEQDSNTFVDNLDSPSGIYRVSNAYPRNIYEEALDSEYEGFELAADSNLYIPPEYTQPKLAQTEGMIWLRIKLDNERYNEDEFLPILKMGNLLLFKGSAQEGYSSQNTITNGDEIFIGSPRYYKRLAAFSQGEWHEILIHWRKGLQDSDCSSGRLDLFSVYIDRNLIPATVSCTERCDEYTFDYCDEYFPFQNSDTLTLMPTESQLSGFPKQSTQRKSGFFIDKIAVSKSDIRTFMQDWLEESITDIFPCWSNINNMVSLEKNPPAQTVIVPGIRNKCSVWNQPHGTGSISIDKSTIQGFDIGIINSDLLLTDIDANLEARKSFDIKCSYQDMYDIETIILTIGDPEIFNFYFTETGSDEITVKMDKNSEKIISYFVTNIDRDSIALDHTVSGNSKARVEFLSKFAGNHRLKISSGDSAAYETLTLNITNPLTNEFVTGKIDVTVLSGNQAPEIYSWSPLETSLDITKGGIISFTHQSRDDRTANLIYTWYENNNVRSSRQNFDFATNANTAAGTYTIKLEVSDGSLKSAKTWTVNVKEQEQTQDDNSEDPGSSYDYTPGGSSCGNNMHEIGEECDGTDNSQCRGYICLENCTCYSPSEEGSCISDWTCTDWSSCQSGIRTRVCSDKNQCSSKLKPSEVEACTDEQQPSETNCTPQWNCTSWSECWSGTKIRQCTDINNCHTASTPSLVEACQSSTQQTSQNNDRTPQNADTAAGQDTAPSTSGSTSSGSPASQQTSQILSDTSYSSTPSSSKQTGSKVDIESQAPGQSFKPKSAGTDKLFTALLWILIGLCLVPFIIIITSKLSKPKQPPSSSLEQSPGQEQEKLANTIRWYKAKGMPPGHAYNMLLRMGFNPKQSSSMVNEIFYGKR